MVSKKSCARRGVALFKAAACGLMLAAQLAVPAGAADKFPAKPMQLVSPLPTGGSTDVATRAWMSCAEKIGGQPFVLQNRPGANGVVAASAFRQLPNDGHSLFVAGMSQMTITPYIFKKQPYDPATEFEGTAIYGTTPFMLVANTQSGIRDMKGLVEFAKKANGIDLGIPVIASPAHLLSAALADRFAFKATLVPTGGEGQGITNLIGGQMPAMIFVVGSAQQFVASGQLVPLMVFTEQRLPQFPNTPTVVEVLGDATMVRMGWLGVAVKGGGSREVIRTVESWTRACLETAEFQQALRNALFTPRFINATEYKEIVRKDTEFWRPLITRLGISNE
jgi:tripartite-type tricarboxylate transporter receptor subunit TctC